MIASPFPPAPCLAVSSPARTCRRAARATARNRARRAVGVFAGGVDGQARATALGYEHHPFNAVEATTTKEAPRLTDVLLPHTKYSRSHLPRPLQRPDRCLDMLANPPARLPRPVSRPQARLQRRSHALRLLRLLVDLKNRGNRARLSER